MKGEGINVGKRNVTMRYNELMMAGNSLGRESENQKARF